MTRSGGDSIVLGVSSTVLLWVERLTMGNVKTHTYDVFVMQLRIRASQRPVDLVVLTRWYMR